MSERPKIRRIIEQLSVEQSSIDSEIEERLEQLKNLRVAQ